MLGVHIVPTSADILDFVYVFFLCFLFVFDLFFVCD
jgi:hypothetical protein